MPASRQLAVQRGNVSLTKLQVARGAQTVEWPLEVLPRDKPETILACYCKLLSHKFDGSRHLAHPAELGSFKYWCVLRVPIRNDNKATMSKDFAPVFLAAYFWG